MKDNINMKTKFIFKKVGESIYEELITLASTRVQPRNKFEVARDEAEKAVFAAHEKDKLKKPEEPLNNPVSDKPEVQFLLDLPRDEYEKIKKICWDNDNNNCDWFTFCRNLGLLPYDKNNFERYNIYTSALKQFYAKEYTSYMELTSRTIINPAIEHGVIQGIAHDAINSAKRSGRRPKSGDDTADKWLSMTVAEYYEIAETVKFWNNDDCCNLPTLYCRAVGILEDFNKNPKSVDIMLEDEIIIENAKRNSRKISLPELPKITKIIDDMRRKLLSTVHGQDNAVEAFCEGFFNAEISVFDKKRKRPLAVFTFAGPPGVGKTYLAETAAENLKLPYKRFNMSDYSSRESCLGLTGFEYTWKDATPGILTSFVRKYPHCILIFDEIEAAHKKTLQIFYSLLDSGFVVDKYMETAKTAAINNALKDADKLLFQAFSEFEPSVSFRDTIIIFTSNVGRKLYEDNKESLKEISRKTLINALKTEINPMTNERYFPAALISRMASGTILLFDYLHPIYLEKIVTNELERNSEIITTQYGVDISTDEKISLSLILREGSNTDARTLKSQAELFFKNQIQNIFSNSKIKFAMRKLKLISFQAELSDSTEEIQELFCDKDEVSRFLEKHMVLNFETVIEFSGEKVTVKLHNFNLCRVPEADDLKDLIAESEKSDVKFDDIIGLQAVKKELCHFIKYLKNPKLFLEKFQTPPRGVLLYGPPGTGKTMLAKAMSSESDVAFFHISAASITNSGVVGAGQKVVEELFRKARRYAPSIIFIDEIDAIGRARGSTATTHAEEMALTTLLTEMDGFSKADPERPVFVLAATNFNINVNESKGETGVLDPALLRRFDRKILIPLPEESDRKELICKLLSKIKVHSVDNETIKLIAVRAAGMSPSEIENIIATAVRAAFNEEISLNKNHILESFELIKYGAKRACQIETIERIARHEAGHVVMGFLAGFTPTYLTIEPRGERSGYFETSVDEMKKASFTKQELYNHVRCLLGGRASEIIYYGAETGITTGASSDLRTATNVVRDVIVNYGMDDKFGLAVMESDVNVIELRLRINEILSEEMEKTILILRKHKYLLDRLVTTLMERKRLTGKEIEEVLTEK